MKTIIASVVITFILLAFIGVEPLSTWKNDLFDPNVSAVNEEYEDLFNEFRRSHNRHPLVFDDRLNEIAAERAVEISKDFSHDGMKYNLGENIAMLSSWDSDKYLLNLWVGSPGHLENILDRGYMRTGFARYKGFAVQVFE